MAAPKGNQYAIRKWNTAAEVYQQAEVYFKECKKEQRPITITGLALALDTTRKVLCDNEVRDSEVGNAVKRVKMIVEQFWEERLGGANATGAIFWLKNHGWKDIPDAMVQNNIIILPSQAIHRFHGSTITNGSASADNKLPQ